MQDMVGGDNNRTPVIFQVPDIYRFVGAIGNRPLETYASNHHISAESIIQYIVLEI
ncbi:hypothetical protein ACFL2E_04950 [Thermodesulfobacteriota bacterium]